MAFYVSYQKSEQMKKGLHQSDRIPLSLINGNQKPQRTKDSHENSNLLSKLEQNYRKSKHTLPFSIFCDEESVSSTILKENSLDIPCCSPKLPSYELEDSETFNKPFFSSTVEQESDSDEVSDFMGFDYPYKEENMKHLRSVEKMYRPNPDYMNLQLEITPNMRSVLVDWLVEVGQQFEFSSEAVHLAVSLTDRFLSCTSVSKNKLQLVGIASLFITAKYEEVFAQELKMYAWITDSTYTKKQILKMEQLIMHRLKFYVGGPTALSFLQLSYSLSRTPEKVLLLGQYLCELSLLDNEPFLSFLPSHIGVAAYCLARYILGYIIWIDELKITGYSLEDLKPVINTLFAKIHSISSQSVNSIREKYSQPEFLRVGEIVPPEILIMCD